MQNEALLRKKGPDTYYSRKIMYPARFIVLFRVWFHPPVNDLIGAIQIWHTLPVHAGVAVLPLTLAALFAAGFQFFH
jgi:hypothetical protein